MMRAWAVMAVALLAGAARAAADDAAESAYARVSGAKVSAEEARARVHALALAMNEAQLSRSAAAVLGELARDAAQPEAIRDAARAELAGRAASDPVALAALLDEGASGKPAPALALQLARGHLERALQLAPPSEGAAFEAIQQGPSLSQASVETQPLDKDLAAELGQTAPDPVAPAPPEARPELSQAQRDSARELDAARALAALASDEPESHEVAGLAALAAADNEGATKEFLVLAQAEPSRSDLAGQARRDRAYLQLARLAYQGGDDARATALYERVGRGAPEWLEALFEASWAHFREGQDEKALGNLLTLHAPFFSGRFFPESFVLKALVLYENCRYADARKTLAEFDQRYRELHEGLGETVARLPTPQSAFELLARGATGVQELPQSARAEVARLAQEPDLRDTAQAAAQLSQELDSIDKRTPAFRNGLLVRAAGPAARAARLQLMDASGKKLVSRLQAERRELRELLSQSLRLSYEIAGREKEQAVSPAQAQLTQAHREPQQIEDGEELWPFEGEYWRDELGSYRFQLGQRCQRARRAPLNVQEQHAAPARVAGDPAQ